MKSPGLDITELFLTERIPHTAGLKEEEGISLVPPDELRTALLYMRDYRIVERHLALLWSRSLTIPWGNRTRGTDSDLFDNPPSHPLTLNTRWYACAGPNAVFQSTVYYIPFSDESLFGEKPCLSFLTGSRLN